MFVHILLEISKSQLSLTGSMTSNQSYGSHVLSPVGRITYDKLIFLCEQTIFESLTSLHK